MAQCTDESTPMVQDNITQHNESFSVDQIRHLNDTTLTPDISTPQNNAESATSNDSAANTDTTTTTSYASLRNWFNKSPPIVSAALPPMHTSTDISSTDTLNSATHSATIKSKSLTTSPKPSFFSTLFSSPNTINTYDDTVLTPTSSDIPSFTRTASTPHSAPATRNRNIRSVSAADTVSVLDSAIAWIRKKSSSNADIDMVDEQHYARLLTQQREKERQQRLAVQAKQIKIAESLRQQWLLIFDQFDTYKHNTHKLQQLCWSGIPSSLRGRAWIAIVGNALNITPELYSILSTRATELRHTVKLNADNDAYITAVERRASRSEEQYQKEESLRCIGKDVPRTFPELKFLHTVHSLYSPIARDDDTVHDTEQYGSLYHLLECYVQYRPDVAYVQGMSYIAAILLINIGNTYESFLCLANLLNQPMYFQFYTMQAEKMQLHIDVFNQLLYDTMPTMYNHFEQLGVKVEMFLYEWLLTIYSRSLPMDITHRIWDNFLVLGCSFLFRTGLGLIHMQYNNLLQSNFEQCLDILMHPSQSMNCNVLFDSISTITLTPQKFDTLVRQKEKQRNT